MKSISRQVDFTLQKGAATLSNSVTNSLEVACELLQKLQCVAACPITRQGLGIQVPPSPRVPPLRYAL